MVSAVAAQRFDRDAGRSTGFSRIGEHDGDRT
jgi:hypothetical protein